MEKSNKKDATWLKLAVSASRFCRNVGWVLFSKIYHSKPRVLFCFFPNGFELKAWRRSSFFAHCKNINLHPGIIKEQLFTGSG